MLSQLRFFRLIYSLAVAAVAAVVDMLGEAVVAADTLVAVVVAVVDTPVAEAEVEVDTPVAEVEVLLTLAGVAAELARLTSEGVEELTLVEAVVEQRLECEHLRAPEPRAPHT